MSIPDGTHSAVVDRFEGDLAALEVRDTDDRYEHVCPRDELPEAARHADAVLEVVVDDGAVAEYRYQPDATTERRTDAQSRFDRLSNRPPAPDADTEADDSSTTDE